MDNKVFWLSIAASLEKIARKIRKAYAQEPDLHTFLLSKWSVSPLNPDHKPQKRTASEIRELVYRFTGFRKTVTATGKALKAAGYVCRAEKRKGKVYRFYYLYR